MYPLSKFEMYLIVTLQIVSAPLEEESGDEGASTNVPLPPSDVPDAPRDTPLATSDAPEEIEQSFHSKGMSFSEIMQQEQLKHA